MQRAITGFHVDEENDWVAELECGHFQHVRHNPPLSERSWVLTDEGRARMLGTLLDCLKCDERAAPEHGQTADPCAGGEISPVDEKRHWWQSVDGEPVPYDKSYDELCKMLHEPDHASIASVALARAGSTKSLELLLSVISDGSRDWRIRSAAARAIGMHPLGRQAGSSIVLQLLDDPNPHVVWSASVAAASLDLAEAVPRLILALNSPDNIISAGAFNALLTLRKSGDLYTLIEMYREADYKGRNRLSYQIHVRIHPAIWREIFDLFKASDVDHDREAAARLAHAFGSAEVIPHLVVLARDENGHVRGAASRAIDEIRNRGGIGGFGNYDPQTPISPFTLGRMAGASD